jgi:tetratricopeptide (TPR) repeat protein
LHAWTESRSIAICGAVLIGAGAIAYSDSFRGPFVFDDLLSIPQNPSLHRLFALWRVLSPPDDGATVSGRPIVNLTLALNTAAGGNTVWGYHLVNLAIHLLAGLTLFGLTRRTIERWRPQAIPGGFGTSAKLLALAISALWTLHPLQTESVTYIVQRAESLMGLFYLQTLYCFIRGNETRKRIWFILSWLACFLGMATKEVMASAPVIVLLYDRTFVAGSLGEAWRRRRGYYAALSGTWLLLAVLIIGTSNRGGTAGFGLPVSVGRYWLAETVAIIRYLRLAVWPHPLVFDYYVQWFDFWPAFPFALAVAFLLAATLWLLAHAPAAGFLGIWFFAILAPTSLVPGIRQTMAEHRMYVALVPIMVLAVMGAHRIAGRRALPAFVAAAIVLGFLTFRRNLDYRTSISLWGDTVQKLPSNPCAHDNLSAAFFSARNFPSARREAEEAIRLKADASSSHCNLANALLSLGDTAGAIRQYATAIRLNPGDTVSHFNLGVAYYETGRAPAAVIEYLAALSLDPNYSPARINLAQTLRRLRLAAAPQLHADPAPPISRPPVPAHRPSTP